MTPERCRECQHGLGYHDDYQVLFGLENFRATYAAGSRDVEDYVILKFDAPAPALKAIALAHEYRNNRKFPFGELVKVVAEEGLEWAETYGSFVQASKADINVLRVAYAHGLAPYIKDYPVAVIKGVVKDKIPYILTGRINAKEAMELEALQTKEKQHDGYVKDTELTAALNRAIRAERKADAMDRAMREFFSGVEQSAIPTRYRNKLVEILKAAVDNNPVG